MLVITAPPWIPVSGVAGPDIVDPITYRLSPEHSLNTELALMGGTRQVKYTHRLKISVISIIAQIMLYVT